MKKMLLSIAAILVAFASVFTVCAENQPLVGVI